MHIYIYPMCFICRSCIALHAVSFRFLTTSFNDPSRMIDNTYLNPPGPQPVHYIMIVARLH